MRLSIDVVEIFVPQWFGTTLWRVPVAGSTFVDATANAAEPELALALESADVSTAPDSDLGPESRAQLVDPPLVPFLATAMPSSPVTTMLLFADPQRVPPLRWWMLGSSPEISWWASRSAKGVTVDGVGLDVDDARLAANALRSAAP